ncbi:hypothetical protein HPB49_009437 [Dermacentor silvarum]|uniref:Uncharacterized protein n=1 Tax=Dermacentor silvarum TaxID=543639 RepID=A0ACB8DXW5_DERSI|nr:hypothetical protein HPB49_009437 [Dermacentor silvarum]
MIHQVTRAQNMAKYGMKTPFEREQTRDFFSEGLKTAASIPRNKDADQKRNRVLFFGQFKLQLKEKYPDSSRRCY